MTIVSPGGISTGEAFGGHGLQAAGDWWSTRYPYRRRITIQALTEDVPAKHTVTATLPNALIDQGKVVDSDTDIEIAYLGDDGWEWLSRIAFPDPELGIQILFNNVAVIPAGTETDAYFVYYGSRNADVANRPNDFAGLTYDIPYNHPRVAYTRPSEHWRGGVTYVPGAKATVEFDGTSFGMRFGAGPDFGIVEIQLDEDPWEELDLYSGEVDDMRLWGYNDLEPVPHKVRIRATGRTNPNSSGIKVQIVDMRFMVSMVVQFGLEEVKTSVEWGGGGLGGG